MLVLAAKAALIIAGPIGIYAVALVSGLADVDAITLSLARFAGDEAHVRVAALGILIAVASNTIVKLAITGFVGGSGVAKPTVYALGAGLAFGGLGLALSNALG